MSKCRVAIIFGGCSEEHDISVKSAMEIVKNMDVAIYEPVLIGITKKGEWKVCDKITADWAEHTSKTAILSPDKGQHGILIFEENNFSLCPIDVIFPVMHGKMGEDGQIQGLLEMSGIPYVGCGIEASVIGVDKSLTHFIAKNAGISVPNFLLIDASKKETLPNLSYPVFVKPARSGSSFGVTKVSCEDELQNAINAAAVYDNKILIEEAIVGTEVGCAVLGNNDKLITGEVDMICLSHGFFRIHQENSPETGSENATIQSPAPLPAHITTQIKETAKRIYKAMGCSGLARVDLFLKEDNTLVLNEVNTMPGCTCYSRYPRMMVAAGIELPEMIHRLVQLALEKGE